MSKFTFLQKLKSFLFLFFLFCSIKTIVAQKAPNELIKFSHTQFIELLTSHKDSVFSLQNAFIYFDTEKDSLFQYEFNDDYLDFKVTDTIVINKKVILKNVHFEHWSKDSGLALHHLKFTKPVSISNTSAVVLSNCVFENDLNIDNNIAINPLIDYFVVNPDLFTFSISLQECIFKGNVRIDIHVKDLSTILDVAINNSIFKKARNIESKFNVKNVISFDFTGNEVQRDGFTVFTINHSMQTSLSYNNFTNSNFIFDLSGVSSSSVNRLEDNEFGKSVLLEIENFNKIDTYTWNDWQGKVLSDKGYFEYVLNLYNNDESINTYKDLYTNDSILNSYIKSNKYTFEKAYKYEKRVLGSFYDFYKSQYDTDFANSVYVTLKDLDTSRYEYLNSVNPSFKNYFTWKINQFLKIFSAYGTSPSKTVVISLYVIFIFAFIYMFFPNSWDTINQNRLMKRIRSYTKYFRNKESMKEIYEEEKKQDLMTFEEFKDYMHQSQKETPRYFLWLAKPIYYFSSTNYKIISKLFDKTDLLKGKWVDLPKNKKRLTSVFMGVWIVFLLIFDLFIKFINALTLSLNTFTTLGFGEIPTKGFPRYLSIIQGFIGWFMLSIFSVSLISQILN